MDFTPRNMMVYQRRSMVANPVIPRTIVPVRRVPTSVPRPASVPRPRIAQQKPLNVHPSFFPNKPGNKICVCSTFGSYKMGGLALFKSIKRHTNCDGVDFKVITANPDVAREFGMQHCHFVTDEIKARYKDVKYSPQLPPENYAPSWWRYEMFSMDQYDRVICLDPDCLCVEDISYLFSHDLDPYDLISVEDHIVSKCFTKYVPELERQGLCFKGLNQRRAEGKIDVQPAVLIANKSIVNKTWYTRLLQFANTSEFTYSIDEGILNDFIYQDGLKIKLLPLEWDYQDLYEIHCPELPVPERPIIVHCQESKPFKKDKSSLDYRVRRWHDRWWDEYQYGKTVVAIVVWNRFENVQRWVRCWNQCNQAGAQLVLIHNLETDNDRYEQLCRENHVTYVPRPDIGYDIGAFQDVCKERLQGFPNDWENLIWITDDCIPMAKDFVGQYLEKVKAGFVPCCEISDERRRHIRTTGFLVTKSISKALRFPSDPVVSRDDCYAFEHRNFNMYDQILQMRLKPCQVTQAVESAPLWDTGCRAHFNLMPKHETVFPAMTITIEKSPVSHGLLDDLAIKHKADKSSLYHNFAVKYDRLFSSIRETATSILEIGVAQGQSVKMWCDYFPNAVIHGADIDPNSKVCESYSPRIKFHLTDQSNDIQLKDLEPFGPFDVIIDDGNHWWKEQILSFQMLFPFVKKGGIYVVEDSCTSYWPEYNNHPVIPVDYFKGLVDAVNLCGARGKMPRNPSPDFGDWHKGWHRREDCYSAVPEFDSIQFMNALIVIHKRA